MMSLSFFPLFFWVFLLEYPCWLNSSYPTEQELFADTQKMCTTEKGGCKERLSWDLFLWDPECVSVPPAQKAKSLCPCSDAWIWEVLWNFSVQLGQFRSDSVSLLRSFGILYVWCSVMWRGSTRISVFYSISQQERRPCREVCTSPRW